LDFSILIKLNKKSDAHCTVGVPPTVRWQIRHAH
jgi:hypothetical protein